MNLLARREQSRSELFNKLSRRFADLQVVEAELSRLADEGLQSDERFAQSFVNSRIGRLQGPLKIRQEIKKFDLDENLVSGVFEGLSVDWQELALEAAQRRFGSKNLSNPKERDRARQFLYRRGFDSQSCVSAIEQLQSVIED